MKPYLLLSLVIFLGCSSKKDQAVQNEQKNDTIASAQRHESAKSDFTLNNLLSFNSEADLIKTFGADVKRSTGYYPEGMGEYQNTLLFPGTKNEVEFVWEDDTASFSGLSYIKIGGEASDWKTKEGIALGTRLKELEKLNRKPFTFSGFGWDYSGTTSWDEGHLDAAKVFVCLGYPGETIPSGYEELIGDQQFKSDSELAQKANPIVREITLRR